jgi:thiamine biosynthesis lipoprotein ApbE
MKRRSFLKLPALLPFFDVDAAFRSRAHHFQYERVIGTSLDLTVCAPDDRTAEHACRTVRAEIDRLASILDTRDPTSEISVLEQAGGSHPGTPSRELADVLNAYEYWEHRTAGAFSIRPQGANTPRNVDALGKAYIIDRAAAAAMATSPSIDGLMLNIGGDIVVRGEACTIAIADPSSWYDNAPPIAAIEVRDAAIATSGSYARGAHLIDARSGQAPISSVAATVVAPDAVTANALATALCLLRDDDGLQLVEATEGSEALRIAAGALLRTSRFAALERPVAARAGAANNWPAGYQLTVNLELTAGRASKRPYVAVWVEDSSSKLVRMLALWGNKSKYYQDLSTLWNVLHGNTGQVKSVTRATRPPGKYELVWDGLDEQHNPMPPGSYRITVETAQEHGTYAKQAGTISLGDSPSSITLPATSNFAPVVVQYGPGVHR